MTPLRLTFALAVSLACSGCFNTPLTQELIDEGLTQNYPHSRADCFKATMTALEELRIPVRKSDPEAGRIVTRRAVAEETATASGNAYSATAQTVTFTHRYYLQVDGSDSECTIRATDYRVWKNNVRMTSMNVAYVRDRIWAPFKSAIREELED